MKRASCTIIFLVSALWTFAQNIATCSDTDFRHVLRNLVTKGNDYYENSNRFGILRMADSIDYCLTQRSKSGMLTRTDSLEFAADRFKLMGSYHYENGNYDKSSYDKAHDNYRQAMSLYDREQAFADDLDKKPMIHRELAQLFYKQENYEEAYKHTRSALDAYENAADLQAIDEDDADLLDLQTQQAICQARMGNTKDALAVMDRLISGYRQDDQKYAEAIRKKAKILMLREEQGGKHGGKTALECYKQYFTRKKTDAMQHFLGMASEAREQYWMYIRPFITDCYRLEDTDAGFLYDVTLFAKGLLLQLDSAGGGRQEINATWQMVQQRLEPDACAIEFVQYEKYGRQQMAALVLKKTGEPVFVKMAQPDSVMQYQITVKGEGRKVSELILAITGADSNSRLPRNKLYTDTLGLNTYLWNEQLVRTIGNANDVWFAPDGYVHQLAIEYMLPRELKGKACHRLTSTRRLLADRHEPTLGRALIVGGVDYLQDGDAQQTGNDTIAYRHLHKDRNNHFGYLKKSKEEADSIAAIRHNAQDRLLTGGQATEQSFRQVCHNYPLIHISTHGLFEAATIPQGTDIKPCATDQTLSECMLAFAGIQHNLNSDTFDDRYQDGILSAKEIASLNLQNAELVVLCCCETGLGHVTADGVYGIQRGLKNAGAQAIICTLWDIDEEASCNFMIQFHRFLEQGNNIYSAFQMVRHAMSDSEASYRDAFILIDAN